VQTITHAGAVRPGDVLISVNGHSSARGITVDRVEITPLGDVRIFGTKHNSIESKLFYRGIRQNLQVVLQRGTRPANALDVAPAVELSVRQIRRDIANGRVPSAVRAQRIPRAGYRLDPRDHRRARRARARNGRYAALCHHGRHDARNSRSGHSRSARKNHAR